MQICKTVTQKQKLPPAQTFGLADPNQNGYGIVSFCDGHAGRISRVDALRRQHTGNPYPDPAVAPFN